MRMLNWYSEIMYPDQKNTVGQVSTGLSMIELLVVLAIIAILAGTALVYINTDGYRLRAEANNLKSTLQEARMEAVTRNENVKLTVYSDRYEVMDNDGELIIPPVNIDNSLMFFTANNEEFQPDTTRNVIFTALGRATFNFHVRLRNQAGNFYKICAQFGGRIWLEYNEAGPCTSS